MTHRRPAGRRHRILRYLGEAFAVSGMARGVSQGMQGGGPADQLAARAAAQDRLRHDEERSEGLLDRVPGILLIAVAAAIVVAVYLLGR